MPEIFQDEPEYDESCYTCGEGGYEGDFTRSEYTGYRYCDYCYDEHLSEVERETHCDGVIQSYGYKPAPNFLSDDGTQSYYVEYLESDKTLTPLYMGFELETENVDGGGLLHGAEHVFNGVNAGGDVVYLKEDGSLSHGFEIVSHPATMGYFMNHFQWKFIGDLRDMGYKAWNAKSCGLHVHLSRSAFVSDKHLAVFVIMLYKNSADMVRFAGRQSSYASWDKGALLNAYRNWSEGEMVHSGIAKFIKDNKRNEQRYTAVNLQPRHTVELRFFRPSLRPETVVAALQMCDAIHQYTRDLSIHDMTVNNALDIRSFRSWLTTLNGKYDVLSKRIDARLDVTK